MTLQCAEDAKYYRVKVCAGKGGDYDTGIILRLRGHQAWVAWDSGVRTQIAIADLEVAP